MNPIPSPKLKFSLKIDFLQLSFPDKILFLAYINNYSLAQHGKLGLYILVCPKLMLEKCGLVVARGPTNHMSSSNPCNLINLGLENYFSLLPGVLLDLNTILQNLQF
jgi:hypothetical protein